MRFTYEIVTLRCPFHDPDDEIPPRVTVGVDVTTDGQVLRVMSADGCRHVEEGYDDLGPAEFRRLCEAIEATRRARHDRALSRDAA